MTLKQTVPPFPVYCNIGLFIVVQRRTAPFDLSFNRTWDEYKNGFGDLNGEFWLGLQKLHIITNQPYVNYMIRFEIRSSSGKLYFDEYNNFYIGNENDRYVVKSAGSRPENNFYGNFDNRGTFYTHDKDNSDKCGSQHNGFWYHSSGCSYMQLNSNVPTSNGISGAYLTTTIQIRPIQV